jgi:hypothetical protein
MHPLVLVRIELNKGSFHPEVWSTGKQLRLTGLHLLPYMASEICVIRTRNKIIEDFLELIALTLIIYIMRHGLLTLYDKRI